MHARGSMETALRAGRYEYDLGHRGTRITTCDLTPGEAEVALGLGYMPWTEEAEVAWGNLWYTELHSCVNEALGDGGLGGGDTVHLLLRASSKVDYLESKARAFADQIFGAGKWKECRLIGPAGNRGMVLSGERSSEEWAMVMIDGNKKLSGPVSHARK